MSLDAKKHIFISYRHDDSKSIVKDIYAQLCTEYGKDTIFLDDADLHGGVEWSSEIRDALVNSKIVLVVIGNRWLTIRDQNDNIKLQSLGDLLRWEVVTALYLSHIIVIPVLVNRANPESLKTVAEEFDTNTRDLILKILGQQSIRIPSRGKPFAPKIKKLIQAIDSHKPFEDSNDLNHPETDESTFSVESEINETTQQTTLKEDEGVQQDIVDETDYEEVIESENRNLETAMPACTQIGTTSKLKVKISLPDSLGLKDELPEILPSGDRIQGGDVQSNNLKIKFPVDKQTGQILNGEVCIKVESNYFDAHPLMRTSVSCETDQYPIIIPVDDDSYTLDFILIPKQGIQRIGLAEVYVHVFQNGEHIVSTYVETRLVNSMDDSSDCGNWRLRMMEFRPLISAIGNKESIESDEIGNSTSNISYETQKAWWRKPEFMIGAIFIPLIAALIGGLIQNPSILGLGDDNQTTQIAVLTTEGENQTSIAQTNVELTNIALSDIPAETDVPIPTDAPALTDEPTVANTDTPIPTETDEPTIAYTNTPILTETDEPTVAYTDTSIPTDMPTQTPTLTHTPTEDMMAVCSPQVNNLFPPNQSLWEEQCATFFTLYIDLTDNEIVDSPPQNASSYIRLIPVPCIRADGVVVPDGCPFYVTELLTEGQFNILQSNIEPSDSVLPSSELMLTTPGDAGDICRTLLNEVDLDVERLLLQTEWTVLEEDSEVLNIFDIGDALEITDGGNNSYYLNDGFTDYESVTGSFRCVIEVSPNEVNGL